jgi:hypothetical protein
VRVDDETTVPSRTVDDDDVRYTRT